MGASRARDWERLCFLTVCWSTSAPLLAAGLFCFFRFLFVLWGCCFSRVAIMTHLCSQGCAVAAPGSLCAPESWQLSCCSAMPGGTRRPALRGTLLNQTRGDTLHSGSVENTFLTSSPEVSGCFVIGQHGRRQIL